MAYEVTATRKRPQTFDGLVGQDFVVSTLHNALSSGRIAHAYLFAGPRGVGKTSAARILARALNCPTGPSAEACVDYPGAEDIAKGRSIDVIEIDGASNTSVNDIRTIKDEVLFPPQSSRYKIYIIDEVHMLSNSAFNALLKTIEEPPPYIIFIFATTEIHKVPATIRSRCQQFNFRLIPIEMVVDRLSEACADLGISADAEALFWIAKEGTGSLRDSYTLFDQVVSFSGDHVSLEKIREKLGFVGLEQLTVFSRNALDGSAKDALESLDSILQAGISVEQCIIDLTEYYRGILLVQTGIRREALLGSSAERFLPEAVKTYTRGQLERIIAMFLHLYREIRYSLDPRCELELAVVKLSRMRFCLDSQEIYERLEDLERRYIHASHGERIEHAREPAPVPVLKHSPEIEKKKLTENETTRNPEVIVPQTVNISSKTPSSENANQATVPGIEKPASAVRTVDLGVDDVARFKQLFARERPMLAGVLDSLESCELRDGRLFLQFDSSFSAQRAREETDTVLTSARQIWPGISGIDTAVRLRKKEDPVHPSMETDSDLAMVKEIFRAEVVQTIKAENT